jgi:hypothetical protein
MNISQNESMLTTSVHNPQSPNKEPMDKNYRITCPPYHDKLKKIQKLPFNADAN